MTDDPIFARIDDLVAGRVARLNAETRRVLVLLAHTGPLPSVRLQPEAVRVLLEAGLVRLFDADLMAEIAEKAEDAFGAFLALGLTTMIAAQAFINMSVVLGLLPTKGLALPLVSNGGSSLLVNLLGMGILLNISQHEAVDG